MQRTLIVMLASHLGGYQREFDRELRQRPYPRKLEAQLFGDVAKYRDDFEPFPSRDFNLYRRHSMNDGEFAPPTRKCLRVGIRPFNRGT